MKPRTPSTAAVEYFFNYLLKNAHGTAKARTARELLLDPDFCEALDLATDGPRKLRALANEANNQGYPICAGNTGYFIPLAPEEANECLGRLRSESLDILERAKHLQHAINDYFTRQERQAFEPAEQISLIG